MDALAEFNSFRRRASAPLDNLDGHKPLGLLQRHLDRVGQPVLQIGANDNAIGTVSVLETACVLANHTPERTIRFLFCNEEHTPWTSVTAAQNARKRGDRIIAVFNIDGVGGKPAAETADGKHTNVAAYTKPAGARLAELMSAVNARFSIGLDQRIAQRKSPGEGLYQASD